MKLRKKLSPSVIEGAGPEETPYRVWDTKVPGLFVRIQPSGVRSFNVQWCRGSSRSLGKWPGVTVSAARERARQILVEVDTHGKPVAVIERDRTNPGTLREFIDSEYRPWVAANLKWQGGPDRILSVFADLADQPLADLTAWQLDKWRNARMKQGRKAATCNRDLDTLRAALYKAVAWGLLTTNPAATVKRKRVDNQRVRYLSDAEAKRLRKALARRDMEGRAARVRNNQWRAERDRPLLPFLAEGDYTDHLTPAVLVSLNTGLRRGELTSLLWSDINLPGCMLTVRAAAAKGGKTRHVPLNVEAVEVLEHWKQQTGGEGRPFPFKDAKTAWRHLLDAAGIEGFRWHDMRHDFASRLVMAGVDLNSVRELMGHTDLKMTLRYAHLAPAHLADAVSKLRGGK